MLEIARSVRAARGPTAMVKTEKPAAKQDLPRVGDSEDIPIYITSEASVEKRPDPIDNFKRGA